VVSADPCQICIFGRAPVYPGSMARTTFPHCTGVAVDCPPLHVLFHWSTPPEEETKQPAGTPEYSETAVMRSGYVAARTFAIIAIGTVSSVLNCDFNLTSGRAASHEHSLWVDAILCGSIFDHVCDRIRISTSIVRQALLARHIPAGPAVWTAWPDRDVSSCVRTLLPRNLRILEVCLSGGLARMDDDHDREICGEFVWLVNVPCVKLVPMYHCCPEMDPTDIPTLVAPVFGYVT
jgi:hypothetical protein